MTKALVFYTLSTARGYLFGNMTTDLTPGEWLVWARDVNWPGPENLTILTGYWPINNKEFKKLEDRGI